MRWSSVVRQCRFDCVRVDLFGLSNMLFMLLFPVLSCVAALVLTVTGAATQDRSPSASTAAYAAWLR